MIQMSLFKNFKKTSSAKSELLETAYWALWFVAILLITLSGRLISEPFLLGISLLLLIMASYWWAIKQSWIIEQRPLFYRGIIAFFMFVLPCIIYFISLGLGKLFESTLIKRYEIYREDFMADQNGFPFIKAFGLEHYGVQVVLAHPATKLSMISLPYQGVGLMFVKAGYCELTLNKSTILRQYNGEYPSAWIKGIMAHELAHCLDVSRDMPSSFKSREIGTKSIAPSESTKVVDLESYLKAEMIHSTRLWREAFADAFSVGFLRMTETEGSDQLVAELLKWRTTGKDTSHATGCWIQHAARTDLPPTRADLRQWADEVRTQAGCVL